MKGPAALLVLVAATWLWQTSGEEHTADEAAATELAALPAGSAPALSPDEAPAATHAALDDVAERAPVTAALLSVRVVDTEGAAISGATATWTTLDEFFLKPWTGWDRQDWAAIEGATVTSQSSETGSIAFSAAPPASDGTPSVVWITHPLHAPHMRLLEAMQEPAHLGELALPPAEPVTVRVVDSLGAPVEGALVQCCFPVPWSHGADTFEPQAARIFQRTLTTGADGQVRAPWFADEVLFQAQLADQQSAVWIGEPRATVTLNLSGTFQVSGALTYAPGTELEQDVRVLCQAQLGGRREVWASEQVGPDGRWGPVALPLGEAEGFHFLLQGSALEVGHKYIAPPSAGAHVAVDFEAHQGTELWFIVVDQEEQTLLDASVTATWKRNGLTTSSDLQARPEDGYMHFLDLPHGAVEFTVQSPGHATSHLGARLLPPAELAAWEIMLTPGGRLLGRVESSQEQLEAFEITWWPTDDRTAAVAVPFRAVEQGEFVLEGLPLQSVSLFASAPGLAPSAIAEVQVSEEAPAPIVLQPKPVLRGQGRVVAAASGLPLADAILQPFATDQHKIVAPWGPAYPVDSDGAFALSAFSAGRTRVRFSAPGYSERWIETIASPGETVDFGSVALAARQTLRVELLWDGDLDPDEYTFWGDGAEDLARRSFGSAGVLSLEDVSSGIYNLHIAGPDEALWELTALCEPGEEWLVQVPVSGARTLRVEVLAERGATLPEGLWVTATLPSGSGLPNRRARRVAADGTVTYRGVLPGSFTVVASSPGAAHSARGGLIADGDQETVVQVLLGAEAQTVRLVDPQGERVPNAWFLIYQPGNHCLAGGGTTDGGGEHPVGLVPGRYHAAISHPQLGHRFDIPLTVRGDRNELIELVLDASLHLEVQLLDGTLPSAGLQCRLFDQAGLNAVPGVTSNGQGLARWSKFAEGRYTIRVRHSDYWPTEATVSARADELSTPIQVRRLGDLELRARSLTTGPAGGLHLRLTSDEFGASVATWLQDERITASSAQLTTGADGVLTLTGLPHGSYSWRAEAPTGELLSGTAIVPPGGLARESITLP